MESPSPKPAELDQNDNANPLPGGLSAADADDERGKIFVGGLSWDTTHDTLLKYFSRYGEVIDCVVMKNQSTGKSRGFGFIKYRDINCVDLVLEAGPHVLDGREVDPKPCNPRSLNKGGKSNENRARKVFVGGLPTDCNEAKLREAFSKYGTVTEVVIMMDQQKQRSRGFGFITFNTEDEVDSLCQQHFIQIEDKKVEVKRAEPRDGKTVAGLAAYNHAQLAMLGIPGAAGLIPSAAAIGAMSAAGFTPAGLPYGSAAFGHAAMPGGVLPAGLPSGLANPTGLAWVPAPHTVPLALPGSLGGWPNAQGSPGGADIATMAAAVPTLPATAVPSYLDLAQLGAAGQASTLLGAYSPQLTSISSPTSTAADRTTAQQPVTSLAGYLTPSPSPSPQSPVGAQSVGAQSVGAQAGSPSNPPTAASNAALQARDKTRPYVIPSCRGMHNRVATNLGILGSYSQETSNYGPSRGLLQDGGGGAGGMSSSPTGGAAGAAPTQQSTYASPYTAITPLGTYGADLAGAYQTAGPAAFNALPLAYGASSATSDAYNAAAAAARSAFAAQGFHPYRR